MPVPRDTAAERRPFIAAVITTTELLAAAAMLAAIDWAMITGISGRGTKRTGICDDEVLNGFCVERIVVV